MPPRVDFSRASHLDLFEQPGISVFQSLLKAKQERQHDLEMSFVLNR
jgi:hypothetical protein